MQLKLFSFSYYYYDTKTNNHSHLDTFECNAYTRKEAIGIFSKRVGIKIVLSIREEPTYEGCEDDKCPECNFYGLKFTGDIVDNSHEIMCNNCGWMA